jgi:hypothetical protein
LYAIIDRVIQTGKPVEIERKGTRVRIVPVKNKSKLHNLIKHPDTIVGDPEEFVHLEWFDEWTEGRR